MLDRFCDIGLPKDDDDANADGEEGWVCAVCGLRVLCLPPPEHINEKDARVAAATVRRSVLLCSKRSYRRSMRIWPHTVTIDCPTVQGREATMADREAKMDVSTVRFFFSFFFFSSSETNMPALKSKIGSKEEVKTRIQID